ncbi:CRE-CDK-4 protein [Caenorhabditis remanei]|uniref:CRE-CDK-4 protein n=1 Tax=Caenorhabditis remanei TaxID=31234 RepID=E3MDY6_CAERE|nr:CRE-CDK-4 protein [Caenorhabditis remanei]
MSENLYGEEHRVEMLRLQKMMNNMNCGSRAVPLTMKDFQIQQALGKGSYGHVYRVRSVRDGKDYALKQIYMSSDKEGIPQSVLREITVMKHLARKAHPNVVGLKSVFHQVDNIKNVIKINMIMEKCDWDLFTFLRNIPRGIPEKQARYVSVQIVKGLDFLHSHNIIHRDLKPQNILVNRDQTVKLADFGLSKEYSNTTAFTTTVVTLWYRPPEVLLQSYYNSSVDMWSVGCIISEIYSREPLFAGRDEAQQLAEIFKKMGTPVGKEWPSESVISKDSFPTYPSKPLKQHNPYMSLDAYDFVQQCLRYDLGKRLSSRAALKHPFLNVKTLITKPRVLRTLNFNK